MNGTLLEVARRAWAERFESRDDPNDRYPPLQMGIEDGVVWAVCRAPCTGVNGYAMIPAEGHPWSAGFPGGASSRDDAQRSRNNMHVMHEVMKRLGIPLGAASPDEMVRVFEEVKNEPGYEESPEQWGIDDFLEAHGGITYYQHPWAGFDTAHAFDVWDAEYDEMGLSTRYRREPHEWDKHWTVELVIEEAKKLARQVAEIGRLERQLEIVNHGETE